MDNDKKSRYEAAREARRQCIRDAIKKEEQSTGTILTHLFPREAGKIVEWIKGDPSFAACVTDQSRMNAVRRVLRELRSPTTETQSPQSAPKTAAIQPVLRTRLDEVLAAAKALSLSERFELLKGVVDLVEFGLAEVQQEVAFNKMRWLDMHEQEKFLKERIRVLSNGTAHRPLVTERHMATPGN